MKILRAYKTKLVLNKAESAYFKGCAGFARFIFNWGLAEWKRQYDAGEKPSSYGLKKQFNAIKDEQFPWAREYPYTIEQESFDNLGNAFKNFFRRVKTGENPGYPKFKSKKSSAIRFSVRGNISVGDEHIKLPVIGWVRLAESGYIPKDGIKILSGTVSERAGNWFVSMQVEEDTTEPRSTTNRPVGVDMGIKSLAVCSNGKVFNNPKTLNQYERRLKRLQRELSRRQKGSANREKTRLKLSRVHRKIADVRRHALHNISHYVTAITKPIAVVIEDLNVRGMTQNHHLAKAISDVALGELRRQIEYKAKWNGNEVVVADRWFPSSKMHHECGAINKDLTLADRTWTCSCGAIVDRDLNAAKNLAAYSRRAEAARIACGVGVQQGATVKQEGGRDSPVRPPAVGAYAPALS